MPTKTKTTRAEKPAAVSQEKPAAAPVNMVEAAQHKAAMKPSRFSGFIENYRAIEKERIEELIERFLEASYPEERNFLRDILERRDQNGTSDTRWIGDFSLPIVDAIEESLNGFGVQLIAIDDEKTFEKVQEFLTGLRESGFRGGNIKRDSHLQTNEEIDSRFRKQTVRHVEWFTRECYRQDMRLLIDIMERWEQITDNPEMRKNTPHHFAAAVEIEMEIFRVREEEDRIDAAKLAAQKGAQ
jgi:hypothetical protein